MPCPTAVSSGLPSVPRGSQCRRLRLVPAAHVHVRVAAGARARAASRGAARRVAVGAVGPRTQQRRRPQAPGRRVPHPARRGAGQRRQLGGRPRRSRRCASCSTSSRASGRSRASRRPRRRPSSSRSRSRCSRGCAHDATDAAALGRRRVGRDAAARRARPLHDRGVPARARGGDPAPAAGHARALDAGGQAVGRRARAADDRHARQRAHAGRHGDAAAAHRRDRAPRSRSSTSPACRRSTR